MDIVRIDTTGRPLKHGPCLLGSFIEAHIERQLTMGLVALSSAYPNRGVICPRIRL